jgi:hypothetical protein
MGREKKLTWMVSLCLATNTIIIHNGTITENVKRPSFIYVNI